MSMQSEEKPQKNENYSSSFLHHSRIWMLSSWRKIFHESCQLMGAFSMLCPNLRAVHIFTFLITSQFVIVLLACNYVIQYWYYILLQYLITQQPFVVCTSSHNWPNLCSTLATKSKLIKGVKVHQNRCQNASKISDCNFSHDWSLYGSIAACLNFLVKVVAILKLHAAKSAEFCNEGKLAKQGFFLDLAVLVSKSWLSEIILLVSRLHTRGFVLFRYFSPFLCSLPSRNGY